MRRFRLLSGQIFHNHVRGDGAGKGSRLAADLHNASQSPTRYKDCGVLCQFFLAVGSWANHCLLFGLNGIPVYGVEIALQSSAFANPGCSIQYASSNSCRVSLAPAFNSSGHRDISVSRMD